MNHATYSFGNTYTIACDNALKRDILSIQRGRRFLHDHCKHRELTIKTNVRYMLIKWWDTTVKHRRSKWDDTVTVESEHSFRNIPLSDVWRRKLESKYVRFSWDFHALVRRSNMDFFSSTGISLGNSLICFLSSYRDWDFRRNYIREFEVVWSIVTRFFFFFCFTKASTLENLSSSYCIFKNPLCTRFILVIINRIQRSKYNIKLLILKCTNAFWFHQIRISWCRYS